VQGVGEAVDGFADVVLKLRGSRPSRGWLSVFGFRGMVVDEAHFIKNKTSERSQQSSRLRPHRPVRPALLMG